MKRQRCDISGNNDSVQSCDVAKRPEGAFIVNVGGTRFSTTKTTLCSHSDFFAAALQSGVFREGCDDSSEFWVDRSSEAFPIILDFMRCGVLLCNDRSLLAKVILDADFYGMRKLLQGSLLSYGHLLA
jgi:hypothetical protein